MATLQQSFAQTDSLSFIYNTAYGLINREMTGMFLSIGRTIIGANIMLHATKDSGSNFFLSEKE